MLNVSIYQTPLFLMSDPCFVRLPYVELNGLVPAQFNDPFGKHVPNICELAAADLQKYLLENQAQWQHNFGLGDCKTEPVVGKMFGVLVVENEQGETGYLSTFSGTLADEPPPRFFVPSQFDLNVDDQFIVKGMAKLGEMSREISRLESTPGAGSASRAEYLKEERKAKSIRLQQQLFDHYHFLNASGKSKSLWAIFKDYSNKNPPSGAGECAAPKLLQYAFTKKMKPLAIAEFWWGEATKSSGRRHREFYPACQNKCRPILSHMLEGLVSLKINRGER